MTVSNVVNGRVHLVRPETRERVDRAIQKLGYRPHVHARALRLARGWAIGMLCITQKSDFLAIQWMSKLVAGLSNYLNEHGYGLLLHRQSPDALDDSILLKWARTDGLIVMLSGPTKEREAILGKLLRLNQPVIALQETIAPRPGQDMAAVRQDDFGAGVKLADHLTSLGARKLVFIEPDFAWPAMAERVRGVTSVIKSVPGASLRVIKCKDEAYEPVENVVLGELKEVGLPDALLGGNEAIALATLTVLESAGYRVPEDVLLTGFNAFEMWFSAKRKITTISFPAYDMGMRAGQMILDRLHSRRFAKRIEILPAELVIGNTTRLSSASLPT